MPTWMASGPGKDWQIAIASRICSLVSHELALHLTDKRHRSAEPEQAETQKINYDLADSAVRRCRRNGHPNLLRRPINPNTSPSGGNSCARTECVVGACR